jgi:hypothetical protein
MAREPIIPTERPRAEPEILPPEPRGSAWGRDREPFFNTRHGQRIFVARVGQWGLLGLALGALLLAAIVVLLLIGAVLVWVPILAVLVLAAAIWRRLRPLR